MSIKNLNRIKKLERSNNGLSSSDIQFMKQFENTPSPSAEMQMKAFLIALKSTSLEEIILKANNLEEPPDEQAETG